MKKQILKTAAIILAASVLGSGCTKKSPPPSQASPPPFQRNESSLAGMVKQERSKIQNDFNNLATYYLSYELEMGKPPAKWEDFKPYIIRDGPASLVSGIEDGRYVVIWKSKPSSNKVLAYEKQPDVNGRQIVVFGDRHMETMDSEELKKTLEKKD